MAIQLTREQEFEGSEDELEALLVQGAASQELTEDEFWESVDRETNDMLAAHGRVRFHEAFRTTIKAMAGCGRDSVQTT